MAAPVSNKTDATWHGADREVTSVVALEARNDLLWIADHWPALRARLRRGGGSALTGMPTGSDTQLPIDTHVSDLMFEITGQVARFYGQILHDETDWQPSTSSMPGLLRDVAERYGHFTSDDPQMAMGFCDDAHDYREKVRWTLERPAPPTYIGPCKVTDCAGELYLRDDRESGKCRECGTEYTRAEQMDWVAEQMNDRLMTASEIVSALVVLRVEPTPGIKTVRSWVRRGKLPEVAPGLYRLADAVALTEKGGSAA